MYTADEYILQKKEHSLFRADVNIIRDEMAKYVEDCPELQKRVKDKEFERNEVLAIARAYNSSCK
jgi:hypothetical protein